MIDWLAAIFELSGFYLVGNKNTTGFILLMIGNAAWTIVAFKAEIYGLLFVVLISLLLNVRNFIKWKQLEKLNGPK